MRSIVSIDHVELSGGMKRRLCLSLAFLGSPALVVLDEPTAGCDSWTRDLIRIDLLAWKKRYSHCVTPWLFKK